MGNVGSAMIARFVVEDFFDYVQLPKFHLTLSFKFYSQSMPEIVRLQQLMCS
jgi:hypothetical protein